MKKKLVSLAAAAVLAFPAGAAAAGTEPLVSIELKRFIGDQAKSVAIQSEGSYKIDNANVRISGADRYDVANGIASSGWSTSNTVFIVKRDAFADALSAAPLAAQLDAPILLTDSAKLTEKTRDQIEKLKPDNIVIVGGKVSVSQTVENQLKSINGIKEITRYAGANRYEVSENIKSDLSGGTETAVLTNGEKYHDALSIAPYAATNKFPILLTKKDLLPKETLEALNGKKKVLVIGGEASVSSKVTEKLNSAGISVERIGGASRYDVASNIAKKFYNAAEEAIIANGSSAEPADALTGSVLASKRNAPILLTYNNRLPDSVKQVIQEKGTRSFTILGGPVSVAQAVENELPNALYLSPGTSYFVKVENKRLGLYNAAGTKIKDFGEKGTAVFVPGRYSEENKLLINNRKYLGAMKFDVKNDLFIKPVNMNIPMEDYLRGVVPDEMYASWNIEALKSQAVSARTYAYKRLNSAMNDTDSFQVYGGYSSWHHNTDLAVQGTKGQVLTLDGIVLQDSVYTSSNGGYTESSFSVPGEIIKSYLTPKQDTYDTAYKWQNKLNRVQISTTGLDMKKPDQLWMKKETDESKLAGLKKQLLKIHPESEFKVVSITNASLSTIKTASGRPSSVAVSLVYYIKQNGKYVLEPTGVFKKHQETFSFDANKMRSVLGTSYIKGTMFQSVAADSSSFTFHGTGFGHGVGLSQHGANNRANKGVKYQDILKFYYEGTQIKTLY
ncbi:SpoIID/LytB domain-containing protein [Bacillus mangrovi]|uniref:SpoIID/LytB domain-containing protein n=1 Tax=Metabacillus mangrovi TaxID=1491830 RepID=A0A7X2V6B1_9BACI|nr:SpoIID/LytB domain-containing protein [Metabacillus mangrovi]MTH55034.1 SpoIID/LytB domain-containing protein [Metabacillus mangrovi]